MAAVAGWLLVGAAVVLGVALNRVELTESERTQMMHNAGTVGFIALATVLIGKLGIGYVPTVTGGVLSGYVAWSVFLWPRLSN